MPLFELGYRSYEGERTNPRMRWLSITRMGVTIAWRSKILRRLVFFAYAPLLYFAPLFWAIGKATDPTEAQNQTIVSEMLKEFIGRELFLQLKDDPGNVRSAVWASVFAFFVCGIQFLLAAIVAAISGPPLIANDMRSRSFLIYFSRPVSQWDYLLGKVGTMAVLLAMVTLGPSLSLYALSIVASPSLTTIAHTLPVAFDIVLASLVVIVPTTLVILWLSSMVRQPRFAALAWAVICGFGILAHQALANTRGLRDASWSFLLSLPATVRAVQLAVFDVPGRLARVEGSERVSDVIQEFNLRSDESTLLGGAFLVVLCGVLVMLLRRRIGAPTKI